MKIGNVELGGRVFLAPMAGVTDLAFRLICKEKGCDLLYTEMINAKALCYDDDNSINALEIAKIAEDAGISAIAVHGRTREQYYSGVADWDIIKQVKETVKIPVIGNGDVFDIKAAIKMLDKTGCDAIMIGRGSQGNPWIFNQINSYLDSGIIVPEPSVEEKISTAIKHLNLALEEDGEYVAVREMRKHIAWYLKGLKKSARLRDEINKIESYEEVVAKLKRYLQDSLT